MFDVIIIGGGASGLMCATTAARRGKKVLVLEHGRQVGQKVLASGGGRCNFSNANISSENYISENPDFCRSALSRFKASDLLTLLEQHGIPYVEEGNGQLFCRGSSRLILNMLLEGRAGCNAKLVTGCEIEHVAKVKNFKVDTSTGAFESRALVVASGGLSYQKLGATGIGYDIAKKFRMKVTNTRPGLVPFVLKRADKALLGRLAGIAVEAELECRGKKVVGGLLFTHKGLSGPAVLQTSLHWKKGDDITIDLLPGSDIFERLKREREKGSRVLLKNFLAGFMPARLADAWCGWKKIEQKPLATYSLSEVRTLASELRSWKIGPAATEDYDSAEVTIGGVDTKGLSSKTFESVDVPGLYFVGEVLDVTGQLGGYNLHWAWASGHAAGASV